MTPEEAINNIEDVLSSDLNYDESIDYQLTSDDIDWLEKAKEALEKQIPKKVKTEKSIAVVPKFQPNGTILGTETESIISRCPLCDETIDVQYGKNVYNLDTKFCLYCGQALDWN